ncbi:hypothetical protein KCMEEFEO_00038 [Pseudomonas phage MD8]|uniref:hypothetical protein n=1 Tax=Pseudomonas phage MD8 TaxID=1868596 RepID=UPI0008041BDE|nr:hypothetical protein [Pseudomonas aeruginosa]YP_009289266.1 hypothetical protein BI094_gp38 [Pseudomonas phage MD8]ANO57340.1 hypothetical protein KCMEEFEO_00038 [Pseudomonas phage MD8]MCV6291808.1 hypothetical protein [Pseudomonas aeruginosa]RTT16098.1 hypothetical protein DY955_19455 [Pseudomonas aeruginosa]
MTKANECTCPSGDGSLRHPCPAHPAVEQAGGDERDFQAEGAQEVPSPVSQEYDRHLISLLRKGEALPGHQEEAADEIERLRDWNDHLNNTVLPNILNPNFLMLMKGGERLLDLCTKDGKFIGVSLNDMKDVFDWMVTHARIAPDHAALAQPSPASELDPLNLAPHAEAFNEAPAEALKPEQEQAEEERPPQPERYTADVFHPERPYYMAQTSVVRASDFDEFATQYERIVGALRAKLQAAEGRADTLEHRMMGMMTRHFAEAWRNRDTQKALDGYLSAGIAQLEQERDAALARVASLESKLAELEKQEPVGVMRASSEMGVAPYADIWPWLEPGQKLYTTPVAQAQHSVPEVSGIGRDFAYPRSVVLHLRTEPTDDDLRAIHDGLRSLAAAPGKEVGHE